MFSPLVSVLSTLPMSLMNKDFIVVTVSMQKCQLLPKGQGPEGTSFPKQQDRTSQVRAHPTIPEVRQPQPWGSGMGWDGLGCGPNSVGPLARQGNGTPETSCAASLLGQNLLVLGVLGSGHSETDSQGW